MKRKKIIYLTGFSVFLIIAIVVGLSWARRHMYDNYGDDYMPHRGDRGHMYDNYGDDYMPHRGDRSRKYDNYDGYYDDDDYYRSRSSRRIDKRWGSSLRSVDANQDGEITQKEVQSFSDKIFNAYDGNGNGQLTEEEFVSYNVDRRKKIAEMNFFSLSESDIDKIKQRSQSRFSDLDDDNSTYLDQDEFINNRMNRKFERLDRDDDGVINLSKEVKNLRRYRE